MGGIVKERIQCPICMDSGEDNLAIYEDDSRYCFSCNKSNNTIVQKVDYKELGQRGISEKTCRKYSYGCGKYNGTDSHFAPFYDDFNSICGYKVRQSKKRFFTLGKVSGEALFGKQLFKPSADRFITITEGELDCLSVSEALGEKSIVVSLACGASSAKKAIAKNLEWLLGFEYCVLCFDNDEVGNKAVQEVVTLFPSDKVRICYLTEKDANDMLKAGKSKELSSSIWNSQAVQMGEVQRLSDVKIKRPVKGYNWKYEELTKITYGIRRGELVIVAGGSGCGKTQFLMETSLDLIKRHKQKLGLLFLEQSTCTTKLQLAGILLNKRLHIPNEFWDETQINKELDSINDNVYIYNQSGGVEFSKLLCVIRNMAANGCSFIIIDNLTSIAALTKSNAPKELDQYMQKLISMVLDCNITVFLASHLAKPSDGGLSYEQGRKVTGSALRGSQSIQFGASLILGIERNKLSNDAIVRNTTTVRVVKNRFTGEDGVSFKLSFNNDTGLLERYDDTIFNETKEVL